ncbi:MAG: hypothetical protein ACTHNU_13560 [Gaiellales bacterium]
MALGPVQMLVVGFDDPNFRGEVLAELERLREHDIVRLVDLLVVRKTVDGELETLETRDVQASQEFGAMVGALVGMGAAGVEGAELGAEEGASAAAEHGLLGEDEVWYVADAIPDGSAAAIALLEHRWAIGLQDAIGRAGGRHLADAWIHPTDLLAIGMAVADEVESASRSD